MPQTFLELYHEFVSEFTNTPEEYHEFIALATIGVIIGNKAYLQWGDGNLYPNFWLLLIGESSKLHKGTALDIGNNLIYLTQEEIGKQLIYPNEFSHESLLRNIAQNPSGAFYYGEFKGLSGILDKNYAAATKATLTNIYDNKPVPYIKELLDDKKGFEIKNTAISIQSTSTMTWLLGNKAIEDIDSGWLPRYMIVPAYKPMKAMPRQPPSDKTKRAKLIEILKEIEISIKGEFCITKESEKVYDDWYMENIYNKKYTRQVDYFIERLSIYCVKIAMVLEVINSMNLIIYTETMQAACKRTNWLIKAIRKLYDEEFTFTKFESDTKRVIDFLKTNGGKAFRSEISDNTRFSKKLMDEVLDTLEEREYINKERVKGKTSPKWLITLLR